MASLLLIPLHDVFKFVYFPGPMYCQKLIKILLMCSKYFGVQWNNHCSFSGHWPSTVTMKIMLAFPVTTLWGRKTNKWALVVQDMGSALRQAGTVLWDHRGGAANSAGKEQRKLLGGDEAWTTHIRVKQVKRVQELCRQKERVLRRWAGMRGHGGSAPASSLPPLFNSFLQFFPDFASLSDVLFCPGLGNTVFSGFKKHPLHGVSSSPCNTRVLQVLSEH